MTELRKQKLLNYLYPNDKVRKFMCNDLYFELNEIIPSSLCLTSKNLDNKIRKDNYKQVERIILNFLNKNNVYKKELEKIYNNFELGNIIDEIIIGYVFYLSNVIRKFNRIDIFLDKKSICYSPISIIDIIKTDL